MATKQKTKTIDNESRVDAMIHRLVSTWLNQQEDVPCLSANQKAQFVAWVGADAERRGSVILRRLTARYGRSLVCNNWRSWPGRPANATRLVQGRK